MSKYSVTSGIIYQGPSQIDGEPIVALLSGANGSSENPKTGRMGQVDVIRSDVSPLTAKALGLNRSICGCCPLIDECYVVLWRGPRSKFDKLQRGGYVVLSPERAGAILKAHNVPARHGAYGDPAAVPFEIWERLIAASGTKWTSYTHQWNEPNFDSRFLDIAMASVDHVLTVEKLRKLHPDARYYRVTKNPEDIDHATEVLCPHKNDAGDIVVTCATCLMCRGKSLDAKNVVIKMGS